MSELSLDRSRLNAEQLSRYVKLAQNGMYKQFHFVRVNPLSEVEDDGRVTIELPFLPCPSLAFQLSRGTYVDDMNYEWYGKEGNTENECAMANLTLLGLGSEYIGNLSFDEKSFELFDLTGGVSVLCESDLSQMKETECGMKTAQTAPIEEPPMQPFDVCEVVLTRILVLYTPAAEAIEPNIQARANLAISQLNSAFANSQALGVGTQAVLAGVQFLNFTETNSSLDDIDTLTSSTIAQSLRNQYNADIVVLLTNGNYGGVFGIVPDIGPISNSAFALVQVSASTGGRLTFAHEVGHLFGARHKNDPASGFAHGFTFHTGFLGLGTKRFTVMAELPPNKSRLSHYSNPNVSFMSKVTGTSANNDNARQIRDAAPIVASFFTEPSGIVVGLNIIVSNVQPCTGGVLQVGASTNCGTPSYSYVWYRSTNNISWVQVCTGISANILVASAAASSSGLKTTFYKVVVTDGTGMAVTKNGSYTTECEATPCPGCPKRVGQFAPSERLSIYPNPSEGEINVTLMNDVDGIIRIDILDITGKVIENIDNSQHSAGVLKYHVTSQELPAGMYLISASGQNFTITEKLVILN